MSGVTLIKKLQNGNRIYGTAIVSPSPLWSDVIKKSELDFVFIDTEHIPIGRETLSNMCRIYSALGFPPIVRITSPDPYQACTALDGGAAGILAPYIESVDEVKRLVGAVKLRPLKGRKLDQILNGSGKLDDKLKSYIEERCKNNMLFINVESQPAVEILSDLLDVPGLDGVIIGPHDLSCSMGLPEEYENPQFEKEILNIIKECRERDLAIGIHLSEEAEQQIKWAEKGVNIILHSSDISLFSKMLQNDISKIKSVLKDSLNHDKKDSVII